MRVFQILSDLLKVKCSFQISKGRKSPSRQVLPSFRKSFGFQGDGWVWNDQLKISLKNFFPALNRFRLDVSIEKIVSRSLCDERELDGISNKPIKTTESWKMIQKKTFTFFPCCDINCLSTDGFPIKYWISLSNKTNFRAIFVSFLMKVCLRFSFLVKLCIFEGKLILKASVLVTIFLATYTRAVRLR